MGYDVRFSSIHDLNKLSYYIVSQPGENTKLVWKFAMTLTYEWDLEVVIYSLWIGLLLM